MGNVRSSSRVGEVRDDSRVSCQSRITAALQPVQALVSQTANLFHQRAAAGLGGAQVVDVKTAQAKLTGGQGEGTTEQLGKIIGVANPH